MAVSASQPVRFALVGAMGYGVNLAVYLIVLGAPASPAAAAIIAFCVAVAHNFAWNRTWTFSAAGSRVGGQAARFAAVSLTALGVNLAVLAFLVAAGADPLDAQVAAILCAAPLSFLANRFWTFARPAPAAA